LVRRTWRQLAPLVVGLVLLLLPPPSGLAANAWHYFAIFAATLTALVLEAMPPGAVGLIGITVAALSGWVDADLTKSLKWMLSGFSESTVWLVVGAFVFSAGYRKTGLGERVALVLVRAFGRHTLGLGYAVVLTEVALAPVTPSNTARSGGIVFPILSNIPRLYGSEPGPTAGRIGTYVMWTAFAATAVTSSMFITALAPNAAALGIVKHATSLDVGWLRWLSGFAPTGVPLLLSVPLLGWVMCRPEVRKSPEISAWAAKELAARGRMSRHEGLMAALLLIAMVLWIGTSVPATLVVFIVIGLMLLSGVIELTDIVSDKQTWEVFLYFTSLLTLASGLADVGFIKWITAEYARPLAGLPPGLALVLLVGLFFWVHYFFSSITAHAAAVLPVVLAAGAAIPGLNVESLAMKCVYALGLMGVLSPYATGPAPIYYGAGYIGRATFWKLGLVFGLVYFVVLVGLAS
jgi:citrate:succinate antiporter/L-tartrate/succinate antiporter